MEAEYNKRMIPFESKINRIKRFKIDKYVSLISKLCRKVKGLKEAGVNKEYLAERTGLKRMQTAEEILSGTVNVDMQGIYFLIEKKKNKVEIVYVGQSKNIYSRVGKHITSKEIKFNEVAIEIINNPKRRLEREREYIRKFKPKHNVKVKVSQIWV